MASYELNIEDLFKIAWSGSDNVTHWIHAAARLSGAADAFRAVGCYEASRDADFLILIANLRAIGAAA